MNELAHTRDTLVVEGCALTGTDFFEVASDLRYLPHGGARFVPLFRSSEVRRDSLLPTRLLGRNIVVHRDKDGMVRALEDRCPHRGVPLSKGQRVVGGIQCAYHGLVVGFDGRCGQLAVPTYALREHAGVVWAFVGDAERADGAPLPDVSPYGTGETIDAILRLDMRTHWSLVMDNAIDLTHAHLHRDVPFFFKAKGVNGIRASDESFFVSYDGIVRNELGLKRPGEIRLSIGGDIVRLEFGRQPIIHSALTPRSADGRELTQWWFVSFSAHKWLRPFVRLGVPVALRAMLRSFQQDKEMLEAEFEAVYDRGHTQYERSPLLLQAHRHLRLQVLRRYRALLAAAPRVEMSTASLLQEVRGHRLVALSAAGGDDAILSEAELAARLEGAATVSVRKHWYAVMLD